MREIEMIDDLTALLTEAATLCESSGYTDQSKWFLDRVGIITSSGSSDLPTVLKEIKDMLAGMGSFSDLSLSPSPDSGMTREQARHRQWNLVSEIDKAIEKMKRTSNM